MSQNTSLGAVRRADRISGQCPRTRPRFGPAVDELEQLHRQQLSFRPDGVPIITIGLTSGKRRVRVTSEFGLVFRMGRHGEKEFVVPAGDECEVRLKNPHRGKVRTWVVAERFVGTDPERIETARARWFRLGYEVKVFMSGTRVDLEGQRLDTRIATIGIAPEASRRRARQQAKKIKTRIRILGRLHSEYLERPGGLFVVTNLRTGERVSSEDLVSVRGTPTDGLVEIKGVKWARGNISRRYPGEVFFLVGNSGKMEVVNQVDAETVVKGVVPTELFPEAPSEALKAQAVLARGQLLSKLGHRHPGKPYHLCARAHCQAYAGIERTSAISDAAVRSTRGEIVFDRFGLTDTVYHASCGGRTEAYNAVWGGPPNRALAGVSDGAYIGRIESDAAVHRHLQSPAKSWCSQFSKGNVLFAGRRVETQTRCLVASTNMPPLARCMPSTWSDGGAVVGPSMWNTRDSSVGTRPKGGRAIDGSWAGSRVDFGPSLVMAVSLEASRPSGFSRGRARTRRGDVPIRCAGHGRAETQLYPDSLPLLSAHAIETLW